MVFSSYLFFFLYFPVTLGIYYLLPMRGKHLGLTLLSYFFYGWANPYFAVLMFASTVIDSCSGLIISEQWGRSWGSPVELLESGGTRTKAQKRALYISLISNLSLLAFFKYFNFGIENYNAIVNALGLEQFQWETFFRVTLPLGISFYTFQSMSYSIDIYRGDAKAIRNFTDFSCYVAMFPQLVAGPIVRFHEVAQQLQHRSHTMEKCARGVAFISLGLAKKILIANPCGKVADVCFEAGSVGVIDGWYGLVGYAFQIYFDFSAYSDMAIGLGLFFGFVFPKNFDSPYHSESITEFWRRWHLSLSHWLRDYLYITLGGNRSGNIRTYVNLALVMLFGGLWHGSSWNFIIWGAIHGGMLAFERMQGKDSFYRRLPKYGRIGVTFFTACIAWVFFRAPDLGSAVEYLKGLFGFSASQQGADLISGILYQPYYVIMMIIAAIITWGAPQTWDFTRKLTWPKAIWIASMLVLSFSVLSTQSFNPFIYFIF